MTYTGVSTISGNQVLTFTLNVPGLSLTNNTGVSSFSNVNALNMLDYTFAASWTLPVSDNSNLRYDGVFVGGYQTPASGVPTSGSANYLAAFNQSTGTNSGFIAGTTRYNCGGFQCQHDLTFGQANININFGTGSVQGALTGVFSDPGGLTQQGSNWNDVNLTGTMSGATMSGTTSALISPTQSIVSPDGESANASGTFNGALYGPNGQQLGIAWTLVDKTKGVSAIGTVTATKQ